MLYTKNDLMEKLENCGVNYSDEAFDVVSNIIDDLFYNEDDDEELELENLDDAIWEETDRSMIYYSDAFSYLQDNNITDFEDAIREFGSYGVCSIATYYLQQEVYELLNEMELEW